MPPPPVNTLFSTSISGRQPSALSVSPSPASSAGSFSSSIGGRQPTPRSSGSGLFNTHGRPNFVVIDQVTGQLRPATESDPENELLPVGFRGINSPIHQAQLAQQNTFRDLLQTEFSDNKDILASLNAERRRRVGGRGSTISGNEQGILSDLTSDASPFNFDTKGNIINPDFDLSSLPDSVFVEHKDSVTSDTTRRVNVKLLIEHLREQSAERLKTRQEAQQRRDVLRGAISGRPSTVEERRRRLKLQSSEDQNAIGSF